MHLSRFNRSTLSVACAIALAGCSATPISAFADATMDSENAGVPGARYYLGLTRIVVPKVQGDLTAYKVQTLGAGFGQDAILGWVSREEVVASPDKCQLLVIIRSDVAAPNARDVLSRLGGNNPCVVDFSRE